MMESPLSRHASKLMQRSERQSHLRLNPGPAKHAQSSPMFGGVLQESRLPHTRLAADHQSSASRKLCCVQKITQGGTVRSTAVQHTDKLSARQTRQPNSRSRGVASGPPCGTPPPRRGRRARADKLCAVTDTKTELRWYLQSARDALLWKLDGLSEYQVRRPLTPTASSTAIDVPGAWLTPPSMSCRSIPSARCRGGQRMTTH